MSIVVVHATHPRNIPSIFSHGYLYPNAMFKKQGITATLAAAYPDEKEEIRHNDPCVYFCTSIDCGLPEMSLTINYGVPGWKDYFEDFEWGGGDTSTIASARLYCTLDALRKYPHRVRKDDYELTVRSPVHINDILGIAVPPNVHVPHDYEKRFAQINMDGLDSTEEHGLERYERSEYIRRANQAFKDHILRTTQDLDLSFLRARDQKEILLRDYEPMI